VDHCIGGFGKMLVLRPCHLPKFRTDGNKIVEDNRLR